MSLHLIHVLSILGISLTTLGACSSAPRMVPTEASSGGEGVDSSVEIRYFLAQDAYRLQVGTKDGKTEGVNGRNDQTLEKKKIGRAPYLNFLQKALRIERAMKDEAKEAVLKDCKTPYAVVISRAGEAESRLSGCRSSDPEGRIGRLIQEGEYLFYAPSDR